MIRNVNTLRETAVGIQPLALEDIFLEKRQIFLTEEINAETSAALMKQLMYLEQENPEKEITLYISSPGGEVTSGLAVYDYIRLMKAPVKTVCIGTAASMGSILFLAGQQREMLEHTKIMIHDPSYAYGNMSGQKPLDMQKKVDDLMKTRKILSDIIATRSKLTIEQVYEKTQVDCFLNAQEALECGIATNIITAASAAERN